MCQTCIYLVTRQKKEAIRFHIIIIIHPRIFELLKCFHNLSLGPNLFRAQLLFWVRPNQSWASCNYTVGVKCMTDYPTDISVSFLSLSVYLLCLFSISFQKRQFLSFVKMCRLTAKMIQLTILLWLASHYGLCTVFLLFLLFTFSRYLFVLMLTFKTFQPKEQTVPCLNRKKWK